MKRVTLLLLFGCLVIQAYPQNADSEKKEIIKVIDAAYVQGIHNVSATENISKGFHPGFNLLGIDQNNNLTKLPIYTWEASVNKRVEVGQSPAVETIAKYPMIDITGTAAVAKVELYRDGVQIFTDYLFLYKFEEGWRIVSKVYYRIPVRD